MQRARLKDIAAKVGCSIAVVSHVVNNSSGNISCRRELRERILRMAQELDYTPRYSSRASRNPGALAIGVCFPHRDGADADAGRADEIAILMGIARICRERACDLLLVAPRPGSEATDCTDRLDTRRVDGLVLMPVEDGADWVLPLADPTRNVVAVNYRGDAALDAINSDEEAAGAIAAAELHQLGHRLIAYAGPLHPGAGRAAQARLAGFLAKCRELGVATEPQTVFDGAFPGSPPLPRGARPPAEIAAHIAAAIQALPATIRPTALVGASDESAMLVMQSLQCAGVAVPRPMSVVGIGDGAVLACATPQISSVRQPLAAMGEEAARHIVQQADMRRAARNGPFARERRWLRYAPPTFIPRESAVAPASR